MLQGRRRRRRRHRHRHRRRHRLLVNRLEPERLELTLFFFKRKYAECPILRNLMKLPSG